MNVSQNIKNKERICCIANCSNPAEVTKTGKKRKLNLCMSCNRAYALGYKRGYYHKNKMEKKNV